MLVELFGCDTIKPFDVINVSNVINVINRIFCAPVRIKIISCRVVYSRLDEPICMKLIQCGFLGHWIRT